MSFSSDIKDVLCAIPHKRRSSRDMLAAGLFCFCDYSGGEFTVRTACESVAKLARAISSPRAGGDSVVRVGRGFLFKGGSDDAAGFCGEFGRSGFDLAEYFGIDPESAVPESAASPVRLFLRGVFLARGSVTDPDRAYHLELTLPSGIPSGIASGSLAAAVVSLLERLSMPPKSISRGKICRIYYKDSSKIEDFLAFIGAGQAVFSLINSKILRGIRNHENRVTNCETNNIGKTVSAAKRYADAINLLVSGERMSTLPPRLRETAELCLKHSGISFAELGALHNPPISKSGVSHRLAEIESISRGR